MVTVLVSGNQKLMIRDLSDFGTFSCVWGAVECRKALFLKRLSRKEEAVESVLLSIKGYPWNWSAWLLLASCLGDRDEVNLEIQIESTFLCFPS